MALQVWLPLNGNLDNQGVANATITAYGAIANANGKIGQCYSFDGSDDYIQITNFNMSGLTEYSIACWLKPSANIPNYVFLVRGGSQHQIRISGDGLCFRDTKNSSQRIISFNNEFVANEWVHICCTYERGEIYIYCNGIQTNHSTSYYHADGQTNSANTEVRIGRQQSTSGNSYYSGLINDFRIYDRALSAREVKELSRGLVRQYTLSQITIEDPLPQMFNAGSNIEHDVSGHNINATLTVGTVTHENNPPLYRNAVKFTGSQRYEADALPIETKTISVWVKTSFVVVSGSSYQFAMWDRGTQLSIGFSTLGIGTYIRLSGSSTGTFVDHSSLYNVNEWNHIVVVKTGATTRDVYVNGEKAPTISASYWGSDTDGLLIGCRHQGGSYNKYFNGELSDFRAYVTQLTADDVLELYHQGRLEATT